MTIRQLKHVGVLVVAGFALAAVYGVVGPHGNAAALHGSNIISTGTFNANGSQTGMSIPASVDTAAEYTGYVNALLHNAPYAGIPGSDYNKYGAAFLVETMMHGQANYNADGALVAAALNDYANWADYVNQYASAGRVNWSRSATLPVGSLNSLHVCVDGAGGYCWNRATYYNNNYNGGGYDAHRFQFYNVSSPEPSTLIIFTNMDGSTYQIRRECANVIGSAKPLQQIGWSLAGQTTASASSIFVNENVTFTNQIKNMGPAGANLDWQVRYCLNACSGGYNSGYGTLNTGSASGMPPNGNWNTMWTWKWFPSHNDTSTRMCVWIAYSNATGSGTAAGHGAWTCVALKPLTPSCGGLNVAPGTFDPTDTYTVTGNVRLVGGKAAATTADADSNFFIHIHGPGTPGPSVNIDNDNVTPVTVGGSPSTSGDGTLAASITPAPTNNAGKYTVTYGIIGPVSPVACTDSFTVAYTPYFSVTGGDVAAGPGFGAACASQAADIGGKNVGPNKGYYGAGTQLGAFALGRITGFATNTTLNGGSGTGGSSSGGSVLQPSGLAFSNKATSPVAAGVWGTTFGKDATHDSAGNPSWCAPDYVAAASNASAAATPLHASTLDQSKLNSLTSGVTYSASGVTTISALTFGGGNPSRVTLVVDGDVIIKGDITYAGYSYVAASANIGAVPQFQLLVKGRIYIDKGVQVLSGFYHAQKRGGGGGSGTIYTCADGQKYLTNNTADGAANASQDANYYADCSQQLTVYGSLAARHVSLLRTGGNWKKTPLVGNQPAEQIMYTPELWLGSLGSTVNGPQPYDSITSLPPVL